MIISFIGLSGCGKSTWASRLSREQGFRLYCCDDLIEKLLIDNAHADSLGGIASVAAWLGLPFSDGFAEREHQYLAAEHEVTEHICDELSSRNASNHENIVIDCSGSVVYLDKTVMGKLKSISQVVYLEVPTEYRQEMFELYLKDPKPVIWGRSFQRHPGESERAALGHSYPQLMEYRRALYEQYADVTLAFSEYRKPGLSSDEFLQRIQR